MQAHISGLSGCAESKMDRKEAEETVLDAAKNMAQFISNVYFLYKNWLGYLS